MKKLVVFPILLIFLVLAFPFEARPQLVLGQYEDEAPCRTWNTFPFSTAASLGRGDTLFTWGEDSSAAFGNPALLVFLPRMIVILNASFHSASFFRYGLVNTGVLSTDKNVFLESYALDFGGFSFKLGNWAVALNLALLEIYDRPLTRYEYLIQGSPAYTLSFDQKGILRNAQFSIARKIFSGLSAGFGVNYVFGNLERETTEKWMQPEVTITDVKSQEFNGLFLNAGFLVELSDRLDAAVIVRTPFLKKSENRSSLSYVAPAGGTDIRIEASSSDSYTQPLVIGIGLSYQVFRDLKAAVDLTRINWSKYSVEYFGEDRERQFKDAVKVGAGLEYSGTFKLFNRLTRLPLRLGVVYDPQPMQEPDSFYFSYTFGTGLQWTGLSLDFGTSIGREKGSGHSLAARRVSLSVRFQM